MSSYLLSASGIDPHWCRQTPAQKAFVVNRVVISACRSAISAVSWSHRQLSAFEDIGLASARPWPMGSVSHPAR